jgi:hypothetical protein
MISKNVQNAFKQQKKRFFIIFNFTLVLPSPHTHTQTLKITTYFLFSVGLSCHFMSFHSINNNGLPISTICLTFSLFTLVVDVRFSVDITCLLHKNCLLLNEKFNQQSPYIHTTYNIQLMTIHQVVHTKNEPYGSPLSLIHLSPSTMTTKMTTTKYNSTLNDT